MKNMKKSVNKRGLSPIIASVLLILMVFILASIIFFWARGFIGEQIEKFGEPIEKSCENVAFSVTRVGDKLLEVLNEGDVNIRYLEIRMTKGGESVLKQFDFPVAAGKFASGDFSFSLSDTEVIVPEKIVVYPALIGKVVGKSSNNVYTCINSGVTL